jgi:pyridoxal phosphate enzyme (YggS family)
VPNKEAYRLLSETCHEYGATLVVVSKTRTEKEVMDFYNLGQRLFAENRAHELIIKASLLPSDIEWHLIGHLQSNKVKSVIPYVSCIQSLDSWKLWMKLHDEAKEAGKLIRCLLQIKIATEESKQGWSFDELNATLKTGSYKDQSNIIINGVMGMASLSHDVNQVRKEMKLLKHHFDELKKNYFQQDPGFNIISMGMSGDYHVALEEGSTMIRIGSLLFD